MKLSKRILSFILAFTILSTMFACVDTGIGKVNAAGSQVNDTVGRPDSPQTPDGEQGTDSSSPRSVAPTQLNNIDSGEDTASDEGEYSKQTNSMGNVLISEFKGYYDGNGMTITVPSSVSISNNNCAGIFGKVSSGAMIKNLNTHISGSITSSSGSAGFIGILEGGTIDNVQVTFNGSLSAPIAGALIGSVTSSGSTSVVKNSAVISNNQVKFIGAKSGTNSLTNNWALIKSVPSNTSLDLGSNNVMYAYPNGSVQLSGSGGAFTFSAIPDSGWTAQYQNSDGEVVYSLPNYTVPISTNGVIYFVKFLKEVNFTASTGGAISPAGIRTLQQGETVDVVATAATGYSFSEFILTGIPASDLVPNSANPNQAVFTMGTAGGTVHAVFAPNTYTVKFNPNGDNVENLPENISATYDVAFSIPSTIPTRDGYVFKYWCTKNVDDGTGIGYSAGTTNLKNLVSENGGEYNFYAIWTVNKYTVSFNANNGSSVAPFMMDYGANFSFPNTVRTGYTFGGWFDNPEFTGTGHAIGSSATVTGNITYHAKWLNNKYTVTFNENGGYNAPSPITAYYDTAFDIPVITPEKMGHTFLGWDNQPTSQEIVYFAGDTGIINLSLGGDPSAAMVPNINLYAVWRVNSYIITWNLAGGSIAGSTQNPQTTVVYGQNYVLPSGTPVRTGYTFTGWYTSSGQGGTLINEGTTVNVTVSSTHYAHWSVNTYTVVFDKNDSAATGTMDPLICTYGIPFSLPLNEYAKTGFRFDGWALSTTGEPVYSNGDEVFQSLTTGNDVTVTLYAKWIPNRFILTFNSNGGTGSMSAMQIEFNSSVVLPTNKFTKSGYTFMGWATSFADAQAGNATYTNGASYTMRTTGATLYAVWSSNPYNVTFYGNGNDGDSSMGVQIMSFGQTANLNRNTYRRTGYSFIGWSTSPGIATVVYNDEASITMNTQGINLYAQWQPNLYTISYNANTSDMTVINIPSSQNAVYDTAINLSSMIPQRTGYSFAGWARVSTAIVSEFSVGQAVTNLTSTHNEDVILYALWSPNVYEVIWALRGGSISGSPQSVVNSVNYNGTYVFPETNPTRTGYVFNVWFSSTAPSATQIIASTTHTTTISRTIYAKWTPITYYVVYNKNAFDAIGTMEKSIHSYDDSNTQIAQNAFTRPGHNFVGWALSADGEVE